MAPPTWCGDNDPRLSDSGPFPLLAVRRCLCVLPVPLETSRFSPRLLISNLPTVPERTAGSAVRFPYRPNESFLLHCT